MFAVITASVIRRTAFSEKRVMRCAPNTNWWHAPGSVSMPR